jgi:putative hydrolase of the HAD superfamily
MAASEGRLRVVTFDLDDTLWDTRAAIKIASASFFSALSAGGLADPTFTPETFHSKMRTVYRAAPGRQHDLTALRREALRRCALEDAGAAPGPALDQLVDAGVAAFLEGRNRPPLFDGVVASLRALKRMGLVLGVITNGNADVQRIAGLDGGLFDFSVTSAEAGAAKPARAPFELAIAKASALVLGSGGSGGSARPSLLPASCFLHVGDDAECDVQGARQLGMRSAWINRPGAGSCQDTPPGLSAGMQADLVLQSVVQLPAAAELTAWLDGPGVAARVLNAGSPVPASRL